MKGSRDIVYFKLVKRGENKQSDGRGLLFLLVDGGGKDEQVGKETEQTDRQKTTLIQRH